ncbi:MAG: TonB-dependent receptor [Epsilonproteobacteria bacterium]|nr:hypothetical protein [Campylobacterota bacterium]NPA56861.1 TonB-dependent receptor [Campylobacterota bacterium]
MAPGFKGKYFSLMAITATVSAVLLHAQEARIEALEKIVISADKSPQTIGDLSDDLTVITAEEISERGWESLDQLLRQVVGADLVQTGGFGQPASLYLQGLSPDKTLILIDGIRYNDPTNLNGAALELIDLDNVERVEILRGPQSGVWGADALAGVINIVTKSPTRGTHGSWKIEGGSFGTVKNSLSYLHSSEESSLALSLTKLTTDGFTAYSARPGEPLYRVKAGELPLEDDGYDRRELTLKGSRQIGDYRLFASLTSLRATIHYDNFGADAPDSPYTINRVRDLFLSIGVERELENHKIEGRYSYSGFKRSQYGGYSGTIRELELKEKIEYGEGRIQLGGGWQRFYQQKSGGIETRDGYQNHYLFLTHFHKLEKITFQTALRFDSYNAFDDRFTFKVGAKYRLPYNLAIAANLGTGYKAPSIFQLNYNATENLQPEKSMGYTLSLEGEFFKVTYFHNRVEDLIQWNDPDGNYTTPNDYYYNASGTSHFKGWELQLQKTLWDQLSLQLGYTYLDPEDSNGRRLPRRAKEKVSYSLTWYPTEEDTLNLNGSYIGERRDIDGSKIGSYNVTNLMVDHRFADHISGFFKIENLFDRFYQEVAGYATPDRSFYIGIRATY